MSDNNLRLQVVLGAVDKLTRPFKNAQAGSKELASAIRQTRDQIKKLSDAGGQLKSFDQLTQSVSRTGAELDQARLRAQMMTREMSSLESPTKKQRRRLKLSGVLFHVLNKNSNRKLARWRQPELSFIGWGYLLGAERVRRHGLHEKLSGITDSWLSRSAGCVKLASVSESSTPSKPRLKRPAS
ncbi:hypothetical protein [Salmonella enterica]|uniref:hypothetical protein n=1 Tax=Salmonella enterica TaxID=28901 RepID=UPI003C70050D